MTVNTEELFESPLRAEHEKLNAQLVPFAGWNMPMQYEGIISEHQAVRESAGLFDVSHMGQIRVIGPDAIAHLQGVLSNDLKKIDAVGDAQYTLLLNDTGGIIDDLIAYRLPNDELMLVVNAANRERDWLVLNEYFGAEAEQALRDETHDWAMLALQGPESKAVLKDLGVELDGVPSFRVVDATVDGHAVQVATTGYTGEYGCELMFSAKLAPTIWQKILRDERVKPAGLGARDTLRLEACFPLYGNDIDTETNPFAAGLGFAVAKDDLADTAAHHALQQLRTITPERRLVAIKLTGRGVPRAECLVLKKDTDTIIGKVSSGTMSPTLKTGIALAWVDTPHHEIGTEVMLDVRGRKLPAEVVKKPFVKGTDVA